MTQLSQPVDIQAGATTQVQDLASPTSQDPIVQPGHMLVDYFRPLANRVMLLGKILMQHALAERRVSPGDLLAFRPWGRWILSVNYL
jgi:hypothetical protein